MRNDEEVTVSSTETKSIARFLDELPVEIRKPLAEAQRAWQRAEAIALNNETGISESRAEAAYERYKELCTAVLVCTIADCYGRTDPAATMCDEHMRQHGHEGY